MYCKWRNVVASERPSLLQFLWVQELTMFLTPNDAKLQKRNIDKNVFSWELDAALHHMACPWAQAKQCTIESLVHTGVGLIKAQLTSGFVGPLMVAKGVIVGQSGV